MSGLWNFSVQVQSWPDKIESDPILIRNIFENHQSDPALICQCKKKFILSYETKELLELFCLQPNTIGWRQNSSSSAFASWGKIDYLLALPKLDKCLFGIRSKSLLELFCHHENPIDRTGQVTRMTELDWRKALGTWPKTLNLKPNPKAEAIDTPVDLEIRKLINTPHVT